MRINIELAQPEDAIALTNLCLISKQYWGYDDAFIDMCRDELTLKSNDFFDTCIAVAKNDKEYCGVIQLKMNALSKEGELEKLFVHPDYMGNGIGKLLYDFGVKKAQEMSINSLLLDADPNAEDFYYKMGAVKIGDSPSGSIPGRIIPRMMISI